MTSPVKERGRPGTRDALLDAVDAIVAERGYAAASLQAVARRAGLTTGAVYSVFGNRGALLAAAMERRSERAGLPEQVQDLRQAVTEFARGYHRAGTSTEGVNLVLFQLDLIRLSFSDPAVAESLRDVYARQLAHLSQGLEERGVPVPATQVAQRLVAAQQGLLLQQIAMGGQLDEQAFVDAALASVGR